jgi:NAD(P)-dependent dehydrogenase (short-subunit alcohol dehydrogenase family)
MQLENKVALVTGAGSGIGRAAAIRMAAEGARVAALSPTEKTLREVVAEIECAGGEALPLMTDITDLSAMTEAMSQIQQRWGQLDIVFANAGINGVWAPLDDLTVEEWDRTLRVNLTGTFITVKSALPLLSRNGGSIIITSSVNGTRIFSNSGASAYSTSKAGQLAFAKMIALELAAKKIRVNVICPGAIDTPINQKTVLRNVDQVRIPIEFPKGWHPLRGERGQPEDVASVVVFLASDASSHVTGTEMWIDGGESLLRG